MFTHLSQTRFWKLFLLSGSLWSSVLFQPALAQDLVFLDQTRYPEGSTMYFTTPDGVSCNFSDRDKPSLTVGAGVNSGDVLPGSSSTDGFYPTRNGSPQPVVGIVLRLPLGSSARGCDQIVLMEEATMRVRKAQELFELGLISEDEFEAIGRMAYEVLSQNQ